MTLYDPQNLVAVFLVGVIHYSIRQVDHFITRKEGNDFDDSSVSSSGKRSGNAKLIAQLRADHEELRDDHEKLAREVSRIEGFLDRPRTQ